MADTPTVHRVRLTDAQLAAVARHAFGLGDAAPLPDGEEWEDAEGALVATRGPGGPTIHQLGRWRSPDDVRRECDRRGWPAPGVWVGAPPADVAALPERLVALGPDAGGGPDHAGLSRGLAAWQPVRATRREVLAVPVPVTPAAPEVGWELVARRYGDHLLGVRVEPGAPGTGGLAVVFTGLSGAGKSTIAGRLVELLLDRGETVTLLDGDDVRAHLSAGLGFTPEDRDTNVQRIAWVAARIAKHGGIAVCAPIAPYARSRAAMRALVEEQAGPGSFLLVHVATPLEECAARDRKGLYARALRGEIPHFTGVSDVYEAPVDADVTLDTRGLAVDESAGR